MTFRNVLTPGRNEIVVGYIPEKLAANARY